jgi:hypothetical protein
LDKKWQSSALVLKIVAVAAENIVEREGMLSPFHYDSERAMCYVMTAVKELYEYPPAVHAATAADVMVGIEVATN